MESPFLKYIDRDHIINIVSDLVRINTVNPPGNEHLAYPLVAPLMESLGMEVKTYEKEPGRTNVVGKIGSGSNSIAFVSHMDTVPPGEMSLWKTDPFEPVMVDGRIYGRGTLDDKGSFAASYSACKAFLKEYPNFDGTIYLIAAADEELGSKLGIIYLVEECGLTFDSAIIPDGGEMNVEVYGEKGIVWVEIVSHGVQAHGSLPSFGRNAIVPLAELIAELKTIDLGKEYNSEFDGWTMNIGQFEGGHAPNMVPARARLVIDFRIPDGLTTADVMWRIYEKIVTVQRKSPSAEFELKVLHQTKPHIMNRDVAVYQAFDRARKNLNIPMKYETMGGNTVAKNLFEMGIPSIVHYPGDHHVAHVPNEYAVVDDLVDASVLYAETLKQYFGM
jgi:acetylornithine deacetylase/succinyl-diaminopimelate desuccinylase family protein